MNLPALTATAVEKLKHAAKSRRNALGCSLAVALDQVAALNGYSNWKRVTELAAQAFPASPRLLPPRHRSLLIRVQSKTDMNDVQVHTFAQLREALGGVAPVLIRQACESASPENPCFCQLDPFATAALAGAALDIGDKHDSWNYLFDRSKPVRDYPAWQKRVVVGLSTSGDYPNEDLTMAAHTSAGPVL